MRHPRSLIFDLGLAAFGCLGAVPAARWLLPVGKDAWEGWYFLAAFAACFLLARLVDRVTAGRLR